MKKGLSKKTMSYSVSSKIGVLNSLVDQVDALFIGGAMSYTFFKALHIHVGNSIVEDGYIKEAQKIMQKCDEKKVKLHLPLDTVVAPKENPEISRPDCSSLTNSRASSMSTRAPWLV